MNEAESLPEAPAGRLDSLDAFRGLTIAGMILVNNPGTWSHVYPPLRHAEWHGFTPTDLVFPSFLFIVGVSIPLALGKRVRRGDAPGSVTARVVRRSILIAVIGLALNAFPYDRPVSVLRVPGVLQRIGVCYLAAALIYLRTGLRSQVAAVALLLLGYWGLMTLTTFPGIGAVDLTRPNNLAARVDLALMPGHTYKPDYDPEGLLSSIPAVATTLLGVLAGRWLSTRRALGERVAGLFAAGSLSIVVGMAWGAVFPVNKALWTSSFVLLTAGLSLQILGLCSWLIEVLGYRSWAWPFVVFGSNPIAAFVLSSLTARVLTMVTVAGANGHPTTLRALLYQQGFAWADPSLASLLWATSYVVFWLAVMSVFYRFKVFIRV